MSCAAAFCYNLFKPKHQLDNDVLEAVTSILVQRLMDTDLAVKTIRAHLVKLTALATRGGLRIKEIEGHAEAVNKRLDEFVELSQSAVHTILRLSKGGGKEKLEGSPSSELGEPPTSPLEPPSPRADPWTPLAAPATIPHTKSYFELRDHYLFHSLLGQGSCAQVFPFPLQQPSPLQHHTTRWCTVCDPPTGRYTG